ncbi:MAG: methyltransferase, partial [Candidatus Bathyarchaeia archaeon]
FLVDVRRVHFNPRLAFEHDRIVRLTVEGETVWDMFSGIGCFAVLIAKTHPTVTVYASDVNPDAYGYLQRNIELNKVQGRVIPLNRDAAHAASNELRGRMDRIIMDLPSNALDFLPAACQALKAEGGVIHVYSFTAETPPFRNTRELVERNLKSLGWTTVNVTAARKVRSSAPHEWMVAIDTKVG